MKLFHKGIIALALVVVESALVSIALGVGGTGIGVIQMLFYASLVSSIVMFIYAFLEDRLEGIKKIFRSKEVLVAMLIAGLLGIAVTTLLLTVGTLGTNPGISGVTYRTYLVIVAVLTPLFLRQRIRRLQMLAILVGFGGVYVLATGGTLVSVNAAELPFILITLASAFATAVSVLLVKRYNTSTSGFLLLANVASFIFSIPLVFAFHVNISVEIPFSSLLSILFIGVIENALASMLFYYSYKVFTTTFVGNALLAIPFLVVLMSFLLVGTQIKAYYVLAAILLAAGMFIQEHASAGAPERIKSRKSLKGVAIFDVTGAFAGSRGALRQHIHGNGRALAMKMRRNVYDKKVRQGIFLKRNCIAFTNVSPHKDATKEEIYFIDKLLGLEKGETALIGLGNPERLEEAFEEFLQNEVKPIKHGHTTYHKI